MHQAIITGDALADIFAGLKLTSRFDRGPVWGMQGRHADLGRVVITAGPGSTYDLRSDRVFLDPACPVRAYPSETSGRDGFHVSQGSLSGL